MRSSVPQSGQRSQGARLEEEPWRVEGGGAWAVCRACVRQVDMAPEQGTRAQMKGEAGIGTPGAGSQ